MSEWEAAPLAEEAAQSWQSAPVEPEVPHAGTPEGWTPAPMNVAQKTLLNSSAVGRIIGAFGSGASTALMPDDPLGFNPESLEWFRKSGIFKRPGQTSALGPITDTIQAFNEVMILPAAAGLDTALRAGGAVAAGALSSAGQIVEETGLAGLMGFRPGELARDVAGAALDPGVMMAFPPAAFLEIPRAPRGPAQARQAPAVEGRPVRAEPTPPPAVEPVVAMADAARPPGADPSLAPRAPTVALGNKTITFPDEAHRSLFEYGEALAFDEADAVAAQAIKAQFPGADVSARAYYDQIAASVRKTEGAGDIAAPPLSKPGGSEISVASRTKPVAEPVAVEPLVRPVKDLTPDELDARDAHVSDALRSDPENPALAEEAAALTDERTGRMDAAVVDQRKAANATVEPAGYGESNLIVPKADYEQARSALREAEKSQAAAGLDPDMVANAFRVAVYHFEAGARGFAQFAKAMVSDFGEWVRPHLEQWYEKASSAVMEFARSEHGGSMPKDAAEKMMRSVRPDERTAGNINLDRISGPEDIRQILRSTAALNSEFTEARRGAMTLQDIQGLADAMGMTPGELLKRKKGQAFSAEEAVASRDLLITSAKSLKDAAKLAQGGADVDVLAFEKALTRHAAIQEQVSGITAEAGRALSSFRIMAKETKEAKRLSEVIDSLGGRDNIAAKAEAISKLDTPEQISRTVAKLRKATTLDMIVEAWINGLLSGPITHATNMASNSLTALMTLPETAVAAAIGVARQAVSAAPVERVLPSEVRSRAFATVQGAKEGVIAGWKAFHEEEATAGKVEPSRRQAIPSVTLRRGAQKLEIGGVPIPFTGEVTLGGKQIRVPGRLLASEDAIFQAIAKRQEGAAWADRKATTEGLTGERWARRVAELMADPPDEMAAAMRKGAEERTFTQPLGPAGRAVQAYFNSHPWLKFVAPFIRTPINIVKYAGQRSPLGVLSREVRENLSGKHGAVARDTQVARLTVGTSVAVAGFALAANGDITGGGPADQRARALLYMTGWQPYSVRIGDSYYSYSRMDPFATTLGVMADAYEIQRQITNPDASDLGTLIIGSISKNLVNKTWLQGPSELLQAVEDPERYGSAWVRGFTSSVIPTGIAQIARTQDPYLRDARTIIDGLKARLPGYSETLFPRRDLWGNEIAREGSAGPDMLSPIYQTQIKNDPIAREMLRLGIWKDKVPRRIQGVDLTAEQYDEYQKVAGRLARFQLSQVVGQPGWEGLPAFAQSDLIENTFNGSRDSARTYMTVRYPEIFVGALQNRVNELTGASPRGGLVPVVP